MPNLITFHLTLMEGLWKTSLPEDTDDFVLNISVRGNSKEMLEKGNSMNQVSNQPMFPESIG
jgi:hypothetical protein